AIQLRTRRFLQPVVFRVADHPNDTCSRAIFNQLDLLTNWILTGPELLSHRLVDDDDARCVSAIFAAKRPTLNERNPNRFEVVWHHGIEHDLRFCTRLWRVAIGKHYRCSATIPAERKTSHQRD